MALTTPTPAMTWDHHHVVPGWEAQGKGGVTDCSLEEEGESDGWGECQRKVELCFPVGKLRLRGRKEPAPGNMRSVTTSAMEASREAAQRDTGSKGQTMGPAEPIEKEPVLVGWASREASWRR